MAIVQALLAMIFRSAGKLLNTAFGWATAMLFGRVAQDRQIYLSVIAFSSIIWILSLLGIAFPAFATFMLSFVPLPSWIDRNLVRLVMLVAACIIPGIVGLVSLKMMEPGQRPKGAGGKLTTVLKGYPYTFGLAVTLILMTVFAPIIKVRNMVRRWTSEHVPVIIEPADYRAVVDAMQKALGDGGIATTRHQASAMLRLPTKILTTFAGGAITNLVADEMTQLEGDGLQVLAHPSDIVISGRERTAARARSVLAERLTFSPAYLTWDKEANEIEDALRAIWDAHLDGRHAVGGALARLADVERMMHERSFPYDEWEVLYREKLVVERRLLRARAGLEATDPSTRPASLIAAIIAHVPQLGETLDSIRDVATELRRGLREAA
jgi:hypothetical protein